MHFLYKLTILLGSDDYMNMMSGMQQLGSGGLQMGMQGQGGSGEGQQIMGQQNGGSGGGQQAMQMQQSEIKL